MAFDAQSRARQRLIYNWNEKHRPSKEKHVPVSVFTQQQAIFCRAQRPNKTGIADSLLQALQKPVPS